jgi:uncharacterized membrane protein
VFGFLLGLVTVLVIAGLKLVLNRKPSRIDVLQMLFEAPVDMGFLATSLGVAKIISSDPVTKSSLLWFAAIVLVTIFLLALWQAIRSLFDKKGLNLGTGGWVVIHTLTGVMAIAVAAGRLS